MEDKKDGEGEFYWQDGKVYKGQWKDGKQHGYGVIIDKDGKEIKAEWAEGKKI